MALFDRVAELIVGESGGKVVSIKDLRFSFTIEKNASSTPNQSVIRIWNMREETRRIVETVNNAVILKAGYAQDTGPQTIFVGVVTRSTTMREGPDWITELELADGLIAYRDGKAALQFPVGSNALTVVAGIAGQFGLPVKPLPTDVAKTYPHGFSFVGRLRDAMNKACDYAGLEWSIVDHEIQIIKKGGVAKKRAIVLSPDTGMIGSPQPEAKTMSEKNAAKSGLTVDNAGVRVKKSDTTKTGKKRTTLEVQGYSVDSLLQPSINPGSYVQVKSFAIDGEFFRVESVTHRGDTGGGEWKTSMVLRLV